MTHSRKLLELIILFTLAISLSVPAWAFDETHLKNLKAINKCGECGFSGANLSEANLDGAILCKTKMPCGVEVSACKMVEKTSKQTAKQKNAAKYQDCIKRCVDTFGACAIGKDMKPKTCGAEATLCLKGC